MAKHAGNRTGREAKRRRRRHERRMRVADERLATAALTEGLRVMEDMAMYPQRARPEQFGDLGRASRLAEPLTDSELAMRYAIESMEHARKGVQLGLNAGGESDLRAYYCEPSTPPKKGV